MPEGAVQAGAMREGAAQAGVMQESKVQEGATASLRTGQVQQKKVRGGKFIRVLADGQLLPSGRAREHYQECYCTMLT